jgi:hypothetical protein
LRYYINTTAARRRSNQPESNMSIQYTNGFSAYAAGYARNSNPVAYCLNGVFNAAQARLRDEWFAGWDAGAPGMRPNVGVEPVTPATEE